VEFAEVVAGSVGLLAIVALRYLKTLFEPVRAALVIGILLALCVMYVAGIYGYDVTPWLYFVLACCWLCFSGSLADGCDSRWQRAKTALLGVAIVLMSRLRLLFPLIAVAEAESINLVSRATGVGCGLVVAAGLMIYQVG
jgi:hypothetical protein